MSQLNKYILLVIVCFTSTTVFSQEISLFQQLNGRYDYLAIGNTLNQSENNLDRTFCETLPNSDALLAIDNDWQIVRAYLYWAGSGTGDTEVSLNRTNVIAEETYTVDYNDSSYGVLTYFSCYADITSYILETGNGLYNFSNLDISETLNSNPGYCNTRTNFAGWSMYVVYENENLPINQINIFQGLEIINRNVQEKNILLDNVNVLDNEGAKIGFLAWEGDSNLNYGESLLINDNLLSNPPLNPENNAFNGTNTFTQTANFYNGDLDVYTIENNISVGDTSVAIKLTTGALDEFGIFQADLIILNNIITVLNSQLPDATIRVEHVIQTCATRTLTFSYTAQNFNATEVLPPNTPISIYANNELIAQAETLNPIPINGIETQTIAIDIPEYIPESFILKAVIDDTGTGLGIVTELNEFNNAYTEAINLLPEPEVINLPDFEDCDTGYNTAYFDLTEQLRYIDNQDTQTATFYLSESDVFTEENAILIPEYYENTVSPQEIYIRINTENCFNFYKFNLSVINCPPYIPQVFTPNNDGHNDWFNIQGLYTIFENHKLIIYNRWGTEIFEGNDQSPWRGIANKGSQTNGKRVPVGTYFYVLYLNDPNYKPITGYVYVTY
ncbi:gliding motility-associated C-terminal domain-containing protein [Bizionia sp. KMM 8389]